MADSQDYKFTHEESDLIHRALCYVLWDVEPEGYDRTHVGNGAMFACRHTAARLRDVIARFGDIPEGFLPDMMRDVDGWPLPKMVDADLWGAKPIRQPVKLEPKK